jgi:hypothetical protein
LAPAVSAWEDPWIGLGLVGWEATPPPEPAAASRAFERLVAANTPVFESRRLEFLVTTVLIVLNINIVTGSILRFRVGL